MVHTPTSDGVDVGIEGTLYFSLNLDHKTLKQFENKFGTRNSADWTERLATPTTATTAGRRSSTRSFAP